MMKVRTRTLKVVFRAGLIVGVFLLFGQLTGTIVANARLVARRPVVRRPVVRRPVVRAPAIRVAGVARRTTRRVIRRSTVYVETLPCDTTVMIDGTELYQCDDTYYEEDDGHYVVVYVD